MGEPKIRTVLGDIEPAELGVCDAHDHLFFASAILPGQELDNAEAAQQELLAFKGAGGSAVVQWTPLGLNRRMTALGKISAETGVHVVAATGFHRMEHYAPHWRGIEDQLAFLFTADLLQGTFPEEDLAGERTGPKAGLIKIAGAFHSIDSHARVTMAAAAIAHEDTGAPIAVHLELGTAALEVMSHLVDIDGVRPDRVILGHLNRNPDLRLLREIAETGAFLAFDGPSRANHATDWRLADCLEALVEAGHGAQLLLGGDTTTAAARGGPGMPYLLSTLRPRLARVLGDDVLTAMLVANPARAFAVDWKR
ncbi:MAG TPA: phosphotriesterase [Amycolatopsis sp.]|nr:phosphotriesterase [Amycolatopsis sp.]